MQFGPVSLAPGSTRNPANGFLDLRQEVMFALAADPPLPGVMRWGVCDFGVSESGDVQHFDFHVRTEVGSADAFRFDTFITIKGIDPEFWQPGSHWVYQARRRRMFASS